MKKNINDISLTINVLQGLTEDHEIANSVSLMSAFQNAINDLKKNPQRLHGIRIEKMFGHLVRALDECSFIKQEDVGTLHTLHDVIPPDYRLILKSGSEFYVEVKNCHKKLGAYLKLNKSYVSKILNYPKVSLDNLKIAVYWSSWGVWTLTPLVNFDEEIDKYVIKMTDALVRNELGFLGDMYYMGIAPLRLEFIADFSKSTELDESGKAGFTIQDVKIYTGKGLVEKNTVEARVIFDLIVYGLNGAWHEENYAEIKSNRIEKIFFEYFPPENNEQHVIIGSLSRTITNKFNLNTAPNGHINKIQSRYNESIYNFYRKIQQEKLKHLSILKLKPE